MYEWRLASGRFTQAYVSEGDLTSGTSIGRGELFRRMQSRMHDGS